MTADQIRVALLTGNFSNEDLVNIGQALQFARSELGRKVKRTITLGSTVKWVSPKNPNGIQGTVTKMGRKNLQVKVGNTLWRVSASLCEAV